MAMTSHEHRARLAIAFAATGSAVGVAVAGSLSPTMGGVVLVASWLGFLYALHAFGRSGGP
jgi:hypothetical protein